MESRNRSVASAGVVVRLKAETAPSEEAPVERAETGREMRVEEGRNFAEKGRLLRPG